MTSSCLLAVFFTSFLFIRLSVSWMIWLQSEINFGREMWSFLPLNRSFQVRSNLSPEIVSRSGSYRSAEPSRNLPSSLPYTSRTPIFNRGLLKKKLPGAIVLHISSAPVPRRSCCFFVASQAIQRWCGELWYCKLSVDQSCQLIANWLYNHMCRCDFCMGPWKAGLKSEATPGLSWAKCLPE